MDIKEDETEQLRALFTPPADAHQRTSGYLSSM